MTTTHHIDTKTPIYNTLPLEPVPEWTPISLHRRIPPPLPPPFQSKSGLLRTRDPRREEESRWVNLFQHSNISNLSHLNTRSCTRIRSPSLTTQTRPNSKFKRQSKAKPIKHPPLPPPLLRTYKPHSLFSPYHSNQIRVNNRQAALQPKYVSISYAHLHHYPS